MSSNLTSIEQLLRPNDRGPSVDAIFREADFFNFLVTNGRVVTNLGGEPHAWNVQTTSAASAELWVEGQAPGVSGTPVFRKASIIPFNTRGHASVTGHVLDQQRLQGLYEDATAKAISDAMMDCIKLFNDTLLGSTQDRGIASVVDATDTYAGIAGSVTEWSSLETAVSGALTLAVLDTMHRTLSDSPRGATPSVILTGLRQKELYEQLYDGNIRRSPISEQGARYDLRGTSGTSYKGIPWMAIRGITASELYMLDLVTAPFELRMQRTPTVRQYAQTSDDITYEVSMRGFLKVGQRRRHGKMTGLYT